MAPWPHGDPNAVVRHILAVAPYRSAVAVSRDAPKKTWLQLLGDAFRDRVWEPFWRVFHDPVRHALSGVMSVSTPIGYAVVGLACLVLGFAAYRLAVAFGRPGLRAYGPTSYAGVELAADRSSHELRARAAEAARAGDYGRAIAALFAAALAALDERAIVAFDRTRTPGEYARLLRRAHPGAARPFGELEVRFVSAAYAERIPTADDYAAAERAYADFEPLAATATAKG